MESSRNKFEEFLLSLEEDKIVSIAGSAGSGKSLLTYFMCEYFLLKNKSILVIDTIADMVIVERITQSNNVKHKLDCFKYITMSDADAILHLVSQLKNMVIVIENLNSLPVRKSMDGEGFDKAVTLNKLYRQLRGIAMDNNLQIVTTNMTYRSMSQNGITAESISGGNAVAYISDTIIGCEKDKENYKNIILKVLKSRNGAYSIGESIFSMENMIKCFIRKQKIKKLLSI